MLFPCCIFLNALVLWIFGGTRISFVESFTRSFHFSSLVQRPTAGPISTVRLFAANNDKKERVAIVGGGISGTVVGHVLQQSGRYHVTLLESSDKLGGHIRTISDPENNNNNNNKKLLNVGHATHMGMFVNLRLMIQHFGLAEWPVGNGPNEQPGLFRMLSIAIPNNNNPRNQQPMMGKRVQPSLQHDILNPLMWWEAFWFYLASYQTPQASLEDYLLSSSYSNQFLNILYWAMATFEFDKTQQDAKQYTLGTARALLITQVFFQFLLCDAFQGSLPQKIDSGLQQDLALRIEQQHGTHNNVQELQQCFYNLTANAPLASYFTTDYNALMERLANGIGSVQTNATVTSVGKRKRGGSNDTLTIKTTNNNEFLEVDHVVLTTHPAIAAKMLNPADFDRHHAALHAMSMPQATGAVGVHIIQAQHLPFRYPPPKELETVPYSSSWPPGILGIFGISQLTRDADTGESAAADLPPASENDCGGWLSVAYPVPAHNTNTSTKNDNPHEEWLDSIPSTDSRIYPWTKATPSFFQLQQELKQLQGTHGVHVIGQAFTGVNKASELQVTNALRLCHGHFGVTEPPWRYSFLYPMLPDCNDADASYQAKSLVEAVQLAFKSLVGSFLLTAAVQKLGTEFFDE